MKKTTLRLTALVALFLFLSGSVSAQQKTTMAALYRQYKPAVITLTDGRVITNPLCNVFLKNSALLYLNNTYTMEANMQTISRVEFDDRKFVCINNQLATLVDSVRGSVLYRIDYLDLEAYEAQLKNNVVISSMSNPFDGDVMQTTTIDLNNEEDYKFPLVHKYYMVYRGETIRVHDREIWRRLPKDKRRQYKSIISLPDFSWVDDASVVQLMKAITD